MPRHRGTTRGTWESVREFTVRQGQFYKLQVKGTRKHDASRSTRHMRDART